MRRIPFALALFLLGLGLAFSSGLSGCGDSDSNPILRPTPTVVPSAPRDNREAEEAALWLSGELFASDDLYDTIKGDLASIRQQFSNTIPRLDIEFQPPWVTGELILGLTPEGVRAIRSGTFEALDSLNAEYHLAGMDTLRLGRPSPFVVLDFKGRLHPERLAEIYGDLEWIEYADPNGLYGDWSNVYPWRRNDARTYLFRHAWGDCPAGCISSRFWYFRAVVSEIDYVGTWEFRTDPEPLWWDEAKIAYHTFRGWPATD